jgi:putative nucleotidyltransferase with HDIG domain
MQDNVRPLVNHRILVADDDQNSARLMSDFLRAKGAAVTYENNGNDAIKSIREHIFDLVILDLRLPGENGFVVAEQAKQRRELSPAVIIVSAFADKQNRLRAFQAYADAFFSKPVDLPELLLVARNLSTRSCRRRCFEMLEQFNAAQEERYRSCGHGERVKEICTAISRFFQLSGDDLFLLQQAAALHDLGKINETEERPHSEVGAELIMASGYSEKVALLVRRHHDFAGVAGANPEDIALTVVLQIAERAAEIYPDSPAQLQEDISRGLLPAGIIDYIPKR